MSYFSIDESMELIKNEYSKELFKEVHSSYAMGNYRSAVVMLWSVVVTDLVLKLKELESVYGDETATRILDDIKKEQYIDPTSSKWEIKIIEKFQKDLNFFETYEVVQMENLQKMRHVSAHPVINNADMLHTPTRSSVYSLIESSLNAVLIKEALFSSKVINFILEDLINIKKTLTTFDEKERFFKHKFLNHMSDLILEKLIKTLWTFVFLKNNADIEANREINFEALEIILKNKKNTFISFLVNEKKLISALSMDENLTKVLLEFLLKNRWLLEYFEKAAIETLHSLVEQRKYEQYAFIKYNTVTEYIENLIKEESYHIADSTLSLIESECTNSHVINIFYDFCIKSYVASESYDQGDNRFNKFILPYYEKFNLDQLQYLIDKGNDNSQVCDRWRSIRDHKLIIEKTKLIFNNFDFSKYENFISGNESLFKKDQVKS